MAVNMDVYNFQANPPPLKIGQELNVINKEEQYLKKIIYQIRHINITNVYKRNCLKVA